MKTRFSPLPSTLPRSLNQRAQVKYSTFAVDPDGTVHPLTTRKNLILDSGLDMVAVSSFPACFRFAAVGTNPGNVPTQRSSGVITFTQAAFTVTASAGFFVSGDVGRILKYGTDTTGTEQYITGFVSSTVVTVSVTATVAIPIVGVVWYVNETLLDNETFRIAGIDTTAGNNQSTTAGVTVTHQRVFSGPPVGGTVTYKEIGWSNNATIGTTLFGRDVITPGDTLVAGQSYRVVVQLLVTYSPATPVANGNVGTLLDTTGFTAIEALNATDTGAGNPPFSTVSASGGTNAAGNFDAVVASIASRIISAAYAQRGAPSTSAMLAVTTVPFNFVCTPAAYVAGSFTQLFTGACPTNTFNGNIIGLCMNVQDPFANVGSCFDTHFNAPQPMLNSQTLTVAWRLNWQRVLDNALA